MKIKSEMRYDCRVKVDDSQPEMCGLLSDKTQSAFTCSNLTIETLEQQGVKYVQS